MKNYEDEMLDNYIDQLQYRLFVLRTQRRLTQKQMAEMCNISPVTYQQMESLRNHRPNLGSLFKVARGLDMSLPELLDTKNGYQTTLDKV